MLRIACALALSALVLASSPASAKPEREVPAEARAHARKGQEHFKAERYAEAIAEYQAAYAITPEPGLLFNIARAYHRQEKRGEALEYYRRYLIDEPQGRVSDEAREYIAALERELPAVEPAAQPSASPQPPGAPPVAPQTRPATWLAGAKIGLHASNVSTGGVDSSTRLGIVAGGFATYVPVEWLALELEVLYAQKGAVPDDDQPLTLHFLELPLLARPTYRGFFVELGPYLGFAIGGDTGFEATRQKLDAGFILGAGYTLALGPGHLVLEVRYELGLVTLKEDDDVKTRTAAFTVGYSFL